MVGWEGKLIPKDMVISELFPEEKREIEELTELAAETDSRLTEMIEESETDSILADISDGEESGAKISGIRWRKSRRVCIRRS